MVAGATDVDYGNYYRYIRGEMFKRANVQYEDPGEASRKRWENIRIPNHFRFQEDLDEVIETIVEVYTQMSKHGMILAGLEDDERKMVQDLSNKVERGTDFRMWFYGTDGYQDIRTVRGWVDRAQKYRSLLAHRRKDAALAAVEVGARGDDVDEFEGQEAEDDEGTDELDEVIGRLNDLRQARGGLRRPSSRSRMRADADKQAGLVNVPQCSDCKGRHRVKPCPNVCARKDKFDVQKAEQSGTRCNFRDLIHVEVVCGGRGHLAKHHRQVEAEAAQYRGVGGGSGQRVTAVTQPVGTKSARGPRPVGSRSGSRPRAAASAGRRPGPRPKSRGRFGRRTRPEHTRVVEETEDEGDEGEEDDDDGEEDPAEECDDDVCEDARISLTLPWSRRGWSSRVGTLRFPSATCRSTWMRCTRVCVRGGRRRAVLGETDGLQSL
jgi:hypothetical protein